MFDRFDREFFQFFIYSIGVGVFITIINLILAFKEISEAQNQSLVEKSAIEAGLVQKVVDNKVIWIKGE